MGGFSFNPFTGKFDKVGASGGGGGGDVVVVDVITVSAPQAAAKAVTLSATPYSATSTLVIAGGVAQTPVADFTVSGTTVSWNGLGMDALPIVAGDILVIVYGS
jgi:hypothetical protein